MTDVVAPCEVVSFLPSQHRRWNLDLPVLGATDVLVVDAVAPCEVVSFLPSQHRRWNLDLPVLGATDVLVVDAVAPCIMSDGVDGISAGSEDGDHDENKCAHWNSLNESACHYDV